MSPDEHLDRIIAKCREVIELGEKRTQGLWEADLSLVLTKETEPCVCECIEGGYAQDCDNAAFIAACAGPAEAAARSTIAAIELIREVANEDGWASVKHYVDIIRAAWPFEIL